MRGMEGQASFSEMVFKSNLSHVRLVFKEKFMMVRHLNGFFYIFNG